MNGTRDMTNTPGSSWARWLLLPAVALVVAMGVWVTGGLITNDEATAKGLTAAWFAFAGLGVVVLAFRYRAAAAPLVIGYAMSAVGLGGFLLYASTVDRVVDEDVVVAPSGERQSPGEDKRPSGPRRSNNDEENDLLAKGMFVDGEHPTNGVASIVRSVDQTFVTLTDFETDPGPDLRVYFVRPGIDVADGEDLGGLKGNRGDQQYELGGNVDDAELARASVVIWCRAFSVAFGTAELT